MTAGSDVASSELDAAAQREALEDAWRSQSAFQLLLTFNDILTNKDANDLVSEFARSNIREIVKDRATAERLCPTYPIGAKRLCIDNGYFETFNRDNVSLVDVREAPIVSSTEKGPANERGGI